MTVFTALAALLTLHETHLHTVHSIIAITIGGVSAYAALRCFYLLYFHPLARFPGPTVAAVSNVWYAYHWLSGRWPWAIENVLQKYGNVVRIAPNELVFFTPQAFLDIYSPQHKNMEVFVKTDFQNRGDDLGGLVWEEDPVRHREVARQLSSAFSSRTIRAMEPLVQKHLGYFIERMKELGDTEQGVELGDWTNWLAMDISGDIAWSENFHQMRDRKNSVYLDVLLGFNAFATIMQVFKRFPLIRPVQYLFAPLSKISSLSQMERATKEAVLRRVENRGRLQHMDYFDFVLPIEKPMPTDRREAMHIGSVALQLMFAGFGPMADWYYGIILFLSEEPLCYERAVAEIRTRFKTLDEMTPAALAGLPYIHACLEETLRLLPSNNTGLPRLSPGAIVDGHYIPKGTHVQSSVFALGRNSAYFHEPMKFRPERWLPADHPLYDSSFQKGQRKGLYPFSLGPRGCVGREVAWTQGRMVISKMLWVFDIIRVPGQDFDLERDLLHYGFLAKPKLQVRFVPVERK
ncbi:putative isotrichodermin c-15 hydroxylase protein [Paramyrothecium foliicola]|nr:putative isotrichodermin c-15 hydroxylase protein [Paramyrothecium foliicola]